MTRVVPHDDVALHDQIPPVVTGCGLAVHESDVMHHNEPWL